MAKIDQETREIDAGGRHLRSPLLNSSESKEETDAEASAKEIERLLSRVGTAVAVAGLDHSTRLKATVSWLLFISFGVLVPAATLWAIRCSACNRIHVLKFEIMILVSHCALAAVSMACMAYNVKKYGLRKLLFVDNIRYPHARFCRDMQCKIQESCRLFQLIILPCLLVKAFREVWRSIYVHQNLWWENVIIVMGILISWLYLTTIFLSACLLFNLVCNLQIVDVQDYAKLLEGTSDVSLFLREHMRLRYQLCKISHRFRIYLLLVFLVVTASQFMTLFETTDYVGAITFLNIGDFLVCSTVQLVGVVLCLRAAAKTTHRAQGIASVASQWHALATLNPSRMSEFKDEANGGFSSDSVFPISSFFAAEYESDLESSSSSLPSDSQLAAQMASYHKRQALVMYFQFNQAGITMFGWAIDRALMCTIFFIELSLVLWVLGKTIVASSR